MSSCVVTISKVGGFPASLRSLLQHFTISWWFVLPPHICSNFPLLQLMTVALSPSLVSLWVGLGSVFSVMTSTLFGNKKQVSFPYLCLFLAEEAQLPSHAQCSSPLSISIVFCWLPSGFPMSFFHWVAQKWKQHHSQCRLMNSKQQRRIVAIDLCVHCSSEFHPCKGAHDSQGMIPSSGAEWPSAVSSSFLWLEELRVRRDKRRGGKKLLGTSILLCHSWF